MRGLIGIVVVTSICACDGSSSGQGSVLQPEDVIVLEEPDAEPIGQPVHISVNEEGRIALIDRLNPGVTLFTARGQWQRKFGSKGTGPGEIEAARLAVFLPGNRIGVVGRGGQLGIFVFDVRSGAYVETIPLQRLPSSVAAVSDGFLFGALNFGTGTSVTELDLPSGRERAFGPIPAGHGYEPGAPIPGIFNHVFAVPTGTGATAVGFEPLSELLLVRDAASAPEHLAIPRRQRRGTPEDLEERVLEAMRRSYEEAFAQGSVLSSMAPLDADRVLLIHQDLMPTLPAVPEAVYMTVIDLNRREACVDTPVPSNSDAPATFAWDGERLGVLQQEVDIATGDAPTVLRWYGVNLRACAWEPLR